MNPWPQLFYILVLDSILGMVFVFLLSKLPVLLLLIAKPCWVWHSIYILNTYVVLIGLLQWPLTVMIVIGLMILVPIDVWLIQLHHEFRIVHVYWLPKQIRNVNLSTIAVCVLVSLLCLRNFIVFLQINQTGIINNDVFRTVLKSTLVAISVWVILTLGILIVLK